ncbi:phosphoribosylamine--glycine ligase [Candidatus Peregrinibacteria bacterium CG11_big_fil_rev_8_21_14_0_20_46_8]|nr:MAG: phosphoribosylamine--glycine ligase [Candidatus Peregrinibacteria bacterium CG11_big_fil_rev_8_21_14_0_20_46_8]
MKALLIGNGAREHCIAEALTKNGKVALSVYAKANNPGMRELAAEYKLGDLGDSDAIVAFAQKVKPHFAFVGPEDPLCAGVADRLWQIDVPVVGPHKAVAQLEGSKSFTRDLVAKYDIPGNPKFRVFTTEEGIVDFIRELDENYVVKAEGLMGGKGVKVSGDHLHSAEEGRDFALQAIEKFGRVVVEEKLVGQEFSLFHAVDGTTVLDMIPAQDHKRAFENDEGPNTGGMGSYTDANHLLPFLTREDVEQAHEISRRVVEAVKQETGLPYKGILYGGFMACKEGVRLIEYNVRFGDPEVMNVLPIMKTDFVDVCLAILNGSLSGMKLEFEEKATVCKYVVPEGYPDAPKKNEKIELVGELPPGVKRYFASVDQREDGLYLGGSRAIGFVGIGDTLAEAEQKAEIAAQTVKGPVFHRKDVGTAGLIQKRVQMMHQLRGYLQK